MVEESHEINEDLRRDIDMLGHAADAYEASIDYNKKLALEARFLIVAASMEEYSKGPRVSAFVRTTTDLTRDRADPGDTENDQVRKCKFCGADSS